MFYGSAYTELAYNIKFIVENYPYKFLVATETTSLETPSSEFSITVDSANEESTIILKSSAIKDGSEEFNFFDNNLEFNWIDYDIVDNNNRRYPIKKVITPYFAMDGIYEIVSVSDAVVINPPFTTYTTLKIETATPHNYLVGQGLNIADNILLDINSQKKTLDENYLVSSVISPTEFTVVNKYSGAKIAIGNFDLISEAVSIPLGFTASTMGIVRKVPLSQNTEPYSVKMTVKGNLTNSQLINYEDETLVGFSGFVLSKKQVKISEFEYNLTEVQKMLLAPKSVNPTPWPRRIVTNNPRHLLSDTVYNAKELEFISWLQDANNLYIKKEGEEESLAYADSYNEYRLVSALTLDEESTNQLIRRCIPSGVISELNDTENQYFQRFVLIAGWMFDQIRVYIKFIKYTHHLNYSEFNQLSPEYYKYYANYYGFELFGDDSIDFSKLVVKTEPGYYFTDPNSEVDTSNKYYRFTLKQLQYEKQKRLLLSLFHLYKTKGTQGAIKKLVSLLGAPEGFLEFNEYSFNIQNTDEYGYYDVTTLKGKRTVNNEKVYTPDMFFEIDPDFPQTPGMPPVYRMKLVNESEVNLRMASILTNPNGAIDYQILNVFGKEKYNYGKLNDGEFANLQDLKSEYIDENLEVRKEYYGLPLTSPDKFSGMTIEYMIPRDGFKKGLANNLEEVTIHICSLYKLNTNYTQNFSNALRSYYSYPMPENTANFNYSTLREDKYSALVKTENNENTNIEFSQLNVFYNNIDITIPYVICRLEGKDLVIRARLNKESTLPSDEIGERVAIAYNIFEADGLNHTLRLIMRPEGVEVYKDYSHLGFNVSTKVSIAKWKDPTTSDDAIPYCAFEIPKNRIFSCTDFPYPTDTFLGTPTNLGEDRVNWWDLFIGLPSNIDFYFKRINIFENYAIDSFNYKDKLLSDKNYTSEYWSFTFTDDELSDDDTTFRIRCETSKINPNINPAAYSGVGQQLNNFPFLSGISSLVFTVISSTAIKVSWDNVGVSIPGLQYLLKRSTQQTMANAVNVNEAQVLEFTDTGLLPNTTYYYTVWITAPNYNSIQYYFPSSATTDGINLPSPATFDATPITGGKIKLDWVAIIGSDKFIIQRSTNSLFTANVQVVYNNAQSGGTALTYLDTSLPVGVQYYYRLKATGLGYSDSAWVYANTTTI